MCVCRCDCVCVQILRRVIPLSSGSACLKTAVADMGITSDVGISELDLLGAVADALLLAAELSPFLLDTYFRDVLSGCVDTAARCVFCTSSESQAVGCHAMDVLGALCAGDPPRFAATVGEVGCADALTRLVVSPGCSAALVGDLTRCRAFGVGGVLAGAGPAAASWLVQCIADGPLASLPEVQASRQPFDAVWALARLVDSDRVAAIEGLTGAAPPDVCGALVEAALAEADNIGKAVNAVYFAAGLLLHEYPAGTFTMAAGLRDVVVNVGVKVLYVSARSASRPLVPLG